MINILAHQEVTHVADDSSGNAGASVAAYAARAGMRAEVFVPAYASPAKQAQIAVYGAEVRPVTGPRVNAKLAMWEAAERGVVPASHAYHPGFLVGQQSVAWEVWEQLGRRAPDWVVVPVGQGLHPAGSLARFLAAASSRPGGPAATIGRRTGGSPGSALPRLRGWSGDRARRRADQCHGRCRAGGCAPAGSAGRDGCRPPHR